MFMSRGFPSFSSDPPDIRKKIEKKKKKNKNYK